MSNSLEMVTVGVKNLSFKEQGLPKPPQPQQTQKAIETSKKVQKVALSNRDYFPAFAVGWTSSDRF